LDGELQEGKVGAARLAIRAKVPVLPVGVVGTRHILPKGKTFPRIKKIIRINIGKPIHLKEYYGHENNKKVLKEATNLIMKRIAGLISKEYMY